MCIYYILYRRYGFLLQRDVTISDRKTPEVIPVVDENLALPVDLPLSLNKNQRWLIPEMLREKLHEPRFRLTGDDATGMDTTRIEFVIRDKLSSNNTCKSILTWNQHCGLNVRGVSDVTEFRSNGLRCQADNILGTPPLFSRRTRREYSFRDFGGPSKSISDAEACVRIEVCVPLENIQTIAQTSRQSLGLDTTEAGDSNQKFTNIRRPWLSRKKNRRGFQKNKRNMLTDFFCCRSNITKQAELEPNYMYYDAQMHVRTRTKFTLLDFIPNFKNDSSDQQTSDTNEKPYPETQEISRDSETVDMNETFVCNEEDFPGTICDTDRGYEISKTASFKETSARTVSDPEVGKRFTDVDSDLFDSIILDTDTTSTEYLSVKYGEQYLEGKCTPRRFLIDISKVVKFQNAEAPFIKQCKQLKPTVWVVFFHNNENSRTTSKQQSFSVSLNCLTSKSDSLLRVKSLENQCVYLVPEVINKAVAYINANPDLDIHYDVENSPIEPTRKRSYLEEVANWTSMSYLPTNSFFTELFFSQQSQRKRPRSVKAGGQRDLHSSPVIEVSLPSPSTDNRKLSVPEKSVSVCKICCLIMEYTSGTTTYNECQHSFCNTCWRDHFTATIDSGTSPLKCPETGCEEIIDPTTVLSFINVSECLRSAKFVHTQLVDADTMQRWCPSYSCRRVIVRNSLRTLVVTCRCGETSCFQCSAKVHWPLPCGLYGNYVTDILTSLKTSTPQEFIVKYDCNTCRLCHVIVPEFEPCSILNCVSNKKLCKRCSEFWHAWLTSSEVSSKETTLSSQYPGLHYVCEPFNNSKFYNVLLSIKSLPKWETFAYQHRLQQHPFRIQKLMSKVNSLSKRVRQHLLREEGVINTLDVEAEGEFYSQEADKSERFLISMVDLYVEISRIVEHGSVMLDTDQTLDGQKADIQYCLLKLSNNTKVLCSAFREGSFYRTGRLVKTLKEDRLSSIKLLMNLILTMDRLG